MRRRRAEKREIFPDAKYNSILVARLINTVLRRGKKSLAERIVYTALDNVHKKIGVEPTEVLSKAIENIRPRVEVKSRRVGGATYQVPVEVSEERGVSLALRWLVQIAKEKKGIPMKIALANEIIDAFNNQGACIKKRDDTHKMAEANRAFAHYAW